MIPLTRPWTTKPPSGTPLDYTNPICRGLRLVDVANAKARDITGNYSADTGNNVLPIIANAPGRGILFPSAQSGTAYRFNVGTDFSDIPALTCASFFRMRAPEATVDPHFLVGKDRSGFLAWNLRSNRNAGGNPRRHFFQINVGGSTTSVGGGGPQFAVDDISPHINVGRYDSGVDHSVWSDGVMLDFDASPSVGNITSRDHDVQLQGEFTNELPVDDEFYLTCVWDRALTDDEIRSFSANPWQIFVPEIVYGILTDTTSILLRGADNGVSGTGTWTVNKPAGTIEGDLIILSVVQDTETNSALVPDGFTEIANKIATQADEVRIQRFAKTAGDSEPATYTIVEGINNVAGKATSETYYSTIGGGVWDISAFVSGDAGSGLACTVSLLSTNDDCFILGAWGNDSESTVTIAPIGMSSATSSVSGVSVALHSYYQPITIAGQETRSLTYSTDVSVGTMNAIRYLIDIPPTPEIVQHGFAEHIQTLPAPTVYNILLSDVASGNAILIFLKFFGTPTNLVSVVSSVVGDTVIEIPDLADTSGGSGQVHGYYIQNAVGGDTTITVTFTNDQRYFDTWAVEVSGTLTTGDMFAATEVVSQASPGGGLDAIAWDSITPTQSNCLLLAVSQVVTNVTIGEVQQGLGWTYEQRSLETGSHWLAQSFKQGTAAAITATATQAFNTSAGRVNQILAIVPLITDRIRFLDTASVGGDGTTDATVGANAAYASLSVLESTERANGSNLVGSNERLRIFAVGVAADAIQVTFTDAWTLDADHDIQILGNFVGRVYNTSQYRVEVNLPFGDGIVELACSHVTLTQVQLFNTNTGNNFQPTVELTSDFSVNHHQFHRCIFRCPLGITNNIGLGTGWGANSTLNTLTVDSCIFYGHDRQLLGTFPNGTCTFNVSNNTLAKSDSGANIRFDGVNGTVNLYNNICQGAGTGVDYLLTFSTVNSSGNISEDATSPDAAFRNLVIAFENEAGDNYYTEDLQVVNQGVGPTLQTLVSDESLNGVARVGAVTNIGAFQSQGAILKQFIFGGDAGADPATITFAGALEYRNLVLVVTIERSGSAATDHNLSNVTAWNKPIEVTTEQGNASFRRSMSVFFKHVEQGDSSTINFDLPGIDKWMIAAEFELMGPSNRFEFLASAANDNGAVNDATSISTGVTTSVTADQLLSFAGMIARNISGASAAAITTWTAIALELIADVGTASDAMQMHIAYDGLDVVSPSTKQSLSTLSGSTVNNGLNAFITEHSLLSQLGTPEITETVTTFENGLTFSINTPAISHTIDSDSTAVIIMHGGFHGDGLGGTSTGATVAGLAMNTIIAVDNGVDGVGNGGGHSQGAFILTAADANWPGAGTFDFIGLTSSTRHHRVAIFNLKNVNQASPFSSAVTQDSDTLGQQSALGSAITTSVTSLPFGQSIYFSNSATFDTPAADSITLARINPSGDDIYCYSQYGVVGTVDPVFNLTANVDFVWSGFSINGLVQSNITAAVNVTLGDDTLSAASVVSAIGSVSITLSDATLAAVTTVGDTIAGSVNITLNNDTLAATSIVSALGSVNVTLNDDTLSANAVASIVGSIANTLGDATLAASALVDVRSSVNATLNDDTLSAATVVSAIGSVLSTLGDATLAAITTVGDVVAGSVNATLNNDTLAATSIVSVIGSINTTIEDATLAAAVLVGDPVVGSVNVTLNDDTLNASAVVGAGLTGFVNVTLNDDTLNAFAFVGDAVPQILLKSFITERVILYSPVSLDTEL